MKWLPHDLFKAMLVLIGVTCASAFLLRVGLKLALEKGRMIFSGRRGRKGSGFRTKKYDSRSHYVTRKGVGGLPIALASRMWRLGFRRVWAALWETGRGGCRGFHTRFVAEVLRTCETLTFLGLNDKGKRHYLSQRERLTHMQVMGRTGSGKSASVLRNLIAQDIYNGSGVIVLDAKGSGDVRRDILGLAHEAGRGADFRLLNLGRPYPMWSHCYNPVRIPPGVEPTKIADRLFTAISPNKEEARGNYYSKQQASVLRLMVRALAGLASPFTVKDLYQLSIQPDLIDDVSDASRDQEACEDFRNMMTSLGRDFRSTLSGLTERLQSLSSVAVLCRPTDSKELQFDDVLEHQRIVYCQLPTGAEPLLARDVARLILQDIEFEASLREIGVHRKGRGFCSVIVDEFYEFAFEDLIGAISKARSSRVGWVLSHQSRGDLMRIGEGYWQGIWDNTGLKVILEQTDPELCDYIARSVGTKEVVKETWRTGRVLGVTEDSGDSSNRRVDEFRFHPNMLRALAPVGQGYFFQGTRYTGINFGFFQPRGAELWIAREEDRLFSPPTSGEGVELWKIAAARRASRAREQLKGRGR